MVLGNGARHAAQGGAVRVDDVERTLDGLLVLDGVHDGLIGQDAVVNHGAVGLDGGRDALRGAARGAGVGGEEGQVQALGLGQLGVLALHQQVGAANDVVQALVAELRQRRAHLLRHKVEEVDEVGGRAGEARAQLLTLGGHAHGAVVGVAHTRHDAAGGNHGHGAEAKLVGAQQCAHEDVAAVAHAAVDAHHHAVAQLVAHQRLVHLGQAHLHGAARVLDGGDGGRAGAAVVAGHLDDVGVGLGHTAGHDTDARLSHQLDRHLGLLVHLVQVVDELGQVLDGVDVVVGGRGDEGHAGLGAAQLRDVGRHLGARQLAALSGLGALRHLDLQLLRVHQVLGGHTEAARRDLLDLGGCDITVAQALQVGGGGGLALTVHVLQVHPAGGVLAALAGVGLAADAVHGDGDCLVRLARDGAQRHAARAEAGHDLLGRLDLGQRDGLAVALEVEAVAQRGDGRLAEVLLVRLVRLGVGLAALAQADRLVQQLGHGLVVGVVLALGLGLDEAIVLQLGERLLGEGLGPERLALALQVGQRHAADAGHGALEAQVDDVRAQAVGLEDLGAVVALQQRDAHLGQNLEDALLQRLLQVLLRVLHAQVGHLAGLDERLRARRQAPLARRLVRQVGADGVRAVADQGGGLVGGEAGRGVHDDRGVGAQARLDQVVVHGAHCKQRGDGGVLGVGDVHTVRQHHALAAGLDRGLHIGTQLLQGALQSTGLAALKHQLEGLGAQHLVLGNGGHLRLQQDGRLEQHLAVGLAGGLQQVAAAAQAHLHAHDQALAQGVNGGVGHLREALLEVVVQRVGLVRQHRQGDVVTHAVRGLHARLRLRLNHHLRVLSAHAGRGLQLEQRRGVHGGLSEEGGLAQVAQRAQRRLQPLLVGLALGNGARDVGVLVELAALQVSHHHLARPQAALGHDVAGVGDDIAQHANLGRDIDHVVAGAPEAGRAQAVAVQARADLLAVGEHEQRGAVPALLQALVVLVEVHHLRVGLHEVGVVAVRLRHQQHQRLGGLGAGAHQQLSQVVQVGRVRLGSRAQGGQRLLAPLPDGVLELVLARRHPVEVALQRVDLAVVAQHAEGLRQGPLGGGVGGEAAVVDGERGLKQRVAQVLEEGAHHHRAEHALVDDGAAGQRAGVEVKRLVSRHALGALLLHQAAHDEQLALQLIAHHAGLTLHHNLPHARLGGLGEAAHHRVVHRHLAPANQLEALAREHLLVDLLALRLARVVVGREDHAHGAGLLVHCRHLGLKQLPGDLSHQASTIARVVVCRAGTAMLHAPQGGQRICHDLVALQVLQGGDEAHSAGIALLQNCLHVCNLVDLGLHGLHNLLTGMAESCHSHWGPTASDQAWHH
mmetsp:Transcript_18872/g.47860  ORF Transcript_18872/g.47860 Transcript_18872/m.47860 type:complete len:1344 (-) Transcript_18872:168-4199(-)